MSVLLLVNPETDEVIYANQDACLFLGYQYQELLKLKFSDLKFDETKLMKYPTVINNKAYLFVSLIERNSEVKNDWLFNDIFYKSPNPIAILDKYEKVIMINPSFTKLFGFGEEIIGNNLDDFIIPHHLLNELKMNMAIIFRGEVLNKELIRKGKDNQLIDVHLYASPIIVDHEIIGVYAVYEDIREQLKDKRQLELFKEIIENNSDGILILDEDKRVHHINNAFTHITGYTQNEVINQIPTFLSSHIEQKNIWLNPEENENYQGEIWIKTKSGKDYLNWLQLFMIKSSAGKNKNYIYTIKNLNELDHMNKKMLLLMQKDPLTSLYNRVYFLDKVHLKEDSYLMFLDINRFKYINDTYGHNVGDEILIEFAKILLMHFKDHLVSRYGGDEFVIFMSDIKLNELHDMIQRLVNIMQKPIYINKDLSIQINTSIGIAKYKNDGNTTQELIINSDQAMYYAKQHHLSYCFFQDINEKLKLARLD